MLRLTRFLFTKAYGGEMVTGDGAQGDRRQQRGSDPVIAPTPATERDGAHRRASSLPAAPPTSSSSSRDSLRHTNSSGGPKTESDRIMQKRPSIISASLAKLQGLKIMQNKDGGEKASNVELEAMAIALGMHMMMEGELELDAEEAFLLWDRMLHLPSGGQVRVRAERSESEL